MKSFVTKHKRLLIIVLIAIIIIGAAYYFTLGKDLFKSKENSEGTDSASGSNRSRATSPGHSTPTGNTGFAAPTFPLRWGVFNGNTKQLQARLNLSITTCKRGSTITEDGILGSQTVTAIKSFFPNIGLSVATNKAVSKAEWDIMINSKPGC